MKFSYFVLILVLLTFGFGLVYYCKQKFPNYLSNIKEHHPILSSLVVGSFSASTIAFPMYMSGNEIGNGIIEFINKIANIMPDVLFVIILEFMSGLVGVMGGSITTIPLFIIVYGICKSFHAKRYKELIVNAGLFIIISLITIGVVWQMLDSGDLGETGFIIGLLSDLIWPWLVNRDIDKQSTK